MKESSFLEDMIIVLLTWGIYAVLSSFVTWAWFFAPCDFIKEYWYLLPVPGRCL